MAWWSSELTPSREGARSIPNPDNPFPTLGIGASPLFRDLAGRFCSILNSSQLLNWFQKTRHLAKIGGGTARTQFTKKIKILVALSVKKYILPDNKVPNGAVERT